MVSLEVRKSARDCYNIVVRHELGRRMWEVRRKARSEVL